MQPISPCGRCDFHQDESLGTRCSSNTQNGVYTSWQKATSAPIIYTLCIMQYCVFSLIASGSYQQLLVVTSSYQQLLVVTSSYQQLLVVTSSYWQLLVVTSSYQQLLVVTGSYQQLVVVTSNSNKLLYLHDRIILQYCKSMYMTIKI